MTSIEDIYSLYLQYPIVCTDTRKIVPGSIFFALKGENFNGNRFAESALESGSEFAVVDDPQFADRDRFVIVNDVLTTLQQLATYHRKQLDIPVIAIVGSNGKTTTKELISSVLGQQFSVLSTPGNFNNHIGLPITLLKLNKQHQIAIIEMGANHIGENALLCDIARPTHGIVTNNGKDHLEGFGSIEGVAKSNSELYYHLLKHDGTAFVNANDEWLVRMARALTKKITYAGNHESSDSSADCIGFAIHLQPHIKFKFDATDDLVVSTLSGDYNFDNIMAAVAIGKHFGLSHSQIKKGIELYVPQNNRSQIVNKKYNIIYLDAYNANPSSMYASLTNFSRMPYSNKTVIIGDMFELGRYAEEEHRLMIELCTKLGFEEVILVGKNFHQQNRSYFKSFATTDEAMDFIRAEQYRNRTFFLKGSRGMKLESLIDAIE